MELFNTILDNINIVLTTIIGIAFGSQLIYTLLFFLPAKNIKRQKSFTNLQYLFPQEMKQALFMTQSKIFKI